MSKYFRLQCKRLIRYLPGALLVMLILVGSLLTILHLFKQQSANDEMNQKFPIALCGDTNDSFLQMGLSALTSFDASRFALEVLETDEKTAEKALARGEIAAYVVVPEGFMDAALSGEILPLKFVTTNGAAGMVSLVKEELSSAISVLLLNSQQGAYGTWDVMADNGLRKDAGKHLDRISLVYVDYIFARDRIYRMEELGVADDLGLDDYILCGLSILFLLLVCLSFAPMMIPGDPALGRLLRSKGKSSLGQALCDFGAYTTILYCMVALLCLAMLFIPSKPNPAVLFWQLLPIVLLAASFSFMIFSFSRDLISGILLMFFVTISLCFVSGCLYPVYFFPTQIQQLAQWLPTGIARTHLSGFITGNTPAWTAPALVGFGLIFLSAGAWARIRYIQEVAQ